VIIASTTRVNPATAFLENAQSIRTAEDLVRAFAHYLLAEACCDVLPIRLDAIRAYLNLPVRRELLPGQRGLTTPDLRIYLNADDREARQNFTLAHEFMEVLFLAIEDGAADEWLAEDVFSNLRKRKEILCDIGAAELLMPLRQFSALVGQNPVTLASARKVADQCQVSLTATLLRIIEHNLAPRILIVWQQKHEPREYVPSHAGQANFFGPPEIMDPPKKLRVTQVASPPSFAGFIPTHKSATPSSIVGQALVNGVTTSGLDDIEIGGLSGRYFVEALPFRADGEHHVLSLIHLDVSAATA
jgi:IrrE N-terminal-like domain